MSYSRIKLTLQVDTVAIMKYEDEKIKTYLDDLASSVYIFLHSFANMCWFVSIMPMSDWNRKQKDKQLQKPSFKLVFVMGLLLTNGREVTSDGHDYSKHQRDLINKYMLLLIWLVKMDANYFSKYPFKHKVNE